MNGGAVVRECVSAGVRKGFALPLSHVAAG